MYIGLNTDIWILSQNKQVRYIWDFEVWILSQDKQVYIQMLPTGFETYFWKKIKKVQRNYVYRYVSNLKTVGSTTLFLLVSMVVVVVWRGTVQKSKSNKKIILTVLQIFKINSHFNVMSPACLIFIVFMVRSMYYYYHFLLLLLLIILQYFRMRDFATLWWKSSPASFGETFKGSVQPNLRGVKFKLCNSKNPFTAYWHALHKSVEILYLRKTVESMYKLAHQW